MHFPMRICTFEFFSFDRYVLFLWVPWEPIWVNLIFNIFVFSTRPNAGLLPIIPAPGLLVRKQTNKHPVSTYILCRTEPIRFNVQCGPQMKILFDWSGHYTLGRCEKWKFGKIYCPQMKLGAIHKNKIVLKKRNF